MATRTWTGASQDGNFDTVGNWSAGVVPVTGDNVVVSGTATYGMTTNLNRITDAANVGLNIVDFEIQQGFSYDIGSLASPLRLTADKFADLGNGNTYFSTDTGSAGLGRATDRVIVDKDDISKFFYMIGDISGNGSDVTLMEVVRGANTYLGDGTNFVTATTLWIAPRYLHTDVAVTITLSCFGTTTFMGGGSLTINGASAGVTTLHLGNGEVDFINGAITTLNQSGGIVQHNCPVADGNISVYNAFGGFFDSRETLGTKSIGTLNRAPQFTYPYNPKLTVSTTNYIGG